MARNRTLTDESLLDAAVSFILEHGPAKLTFASLGQIVGLAPATLVQRFATKDQLLIAAAEHCMLDVTRTFKDAGDSHVSPLKGLQSALTSLVSPINSVRTFANGLAFLQIDLAHPKLSELTRQGQMQMRNQIKIFLEAAVIARELRPCDTEVLTLTVQATYHGALITWAIHQKDPIDSWVRARLEAVLEPYREHHAA